jgi:hypothetical protein
LDEPPVADEPVLGLAALPPALECDGGAAAELPPAFECEGGAEAPDEPVLGFAGLGGFAGFAGFVAAEPLLELAGGALETDPEFPPAFECAGGPALVVAPSSSPVACAAGMPSATLAVATVRAITSLAANACVLIRYPPM